MKPVVVASFNDDSALRCVDIRRETGGYFWIECRRDPEDAHGWRPLGVPAGGFADADDAMDDARRHVGWLAA